MMNPIQDEPSLFRNRDGAVISEDKSFLEKRKSIKIRREEEKRRVEDLISRVDRLETLLQSIIGNK